LRHALGRRIPVKPKAQIRKPATVTKIIKQRVPEVEKAQIEIHDGEHLYSEIRVENALEEDGTGKKVKLKPGSKVDVTIEADPDETTDK
jgi:hypothetical protein